MKHTILLAETGTMHPDGTFSLLRAGIGCVWGQKLPIVLDGVVLVRFCGYPSEGGEHNWLLCIVDADGNRVVPDLTGTFTLAEEGGIGHFLTRFRIPFKAYGCYSFRVSVDKSCGDDWPFEVSEHGPTQVQQG